MIAMSTVITVVTATLHLKLNSENNKLIQELNERIESDPNYPMIPSSTYTNQKVNSESVKYISRQLYDRADSSKLVELLDRLLLINTCLLDDHQLSYQTIHNKPNKNHQFKNNSNFKSIIFFNYLTAVNHIF